MYEWVLLDNSTEAEGFESLTFTYYRHLLQKLETDTNIIAFGVRSQSEPVGLLLAVYNPDGEPEKVAAVRSLFITPEYRHQGLGKRLLKDLDAELQRRKCDRVEFNYTENLHLENLNVLLLKCGWQAPKNTAILVYCSAAKVRTAPHPHLIERVDEFRAKLSTEYEIFPWTELTAIEREAIGQRMRTDNLWSKYNPFVGENVIDTISSFGVRYRGQVIGWSIAHRMVADSTTFAQMFVSPECPLRPRVALPLMARAIKACFDSGCPQATFRTETSNKPMLKFIDRWLTPYIETTRSVWSSYKVFSPL